MGQVLLTDDRGTSTGGYRARHRARTICATCTPISSHILAGSLDDFKGDDAIAIGVGLARRFGIAVGGQLTLVSPQGAATAFGTIPRVRAYRSSAIFQVGMNEYDTRLRVPAAEAAQIFFQKPGEATQIEVTVADPDRVGAVQPRDPRGA